MNQQLNSPSTIDYRNARYQGHTDGQGNRQSLGILIDDDLSFYVSHWNNNLLDGQTLVYISHGKYIYGQWHLNQPNGINVFRTGDTVLVGQFVNGKIIGKILVIFERYNIIAVLQTKAQNEKFEVLECGRLTTHDDLLKYIDMLDIQMPENYFSLIKFVTSLTAQQDEDSQALIACPCERENCYFGYRDGLAIIFNSNNGVVSVGHHQNKQLFGFGGKFDGKKIEEGNFQLQQTISYSKKRPDNDINTIFQKIHKRSLNFKNQYFDSKVKTLGDLQTILRGNIQKIVNYNIKNGIREANAQDLNDSLDYQNLNEYESIKTAENRQNMYEKQHVPMKKVTSQYYKQEKQSKSYSKNTRPNISQSTSRRINRANIQSEKQLQTHVQQTLRKTPNKDSTTYYAKKSPIRFKQEDRDVYGKQSKTNSKANQSCEQQIVNQKHYFEPQQKQQSRIGKTYNRNSLYQRVQRTNDKSPLAHSKNVDTKIVLSEVGDKIPKFGGLELQESQKPYLKSTVDYEVEQYKKQLQKSRSKERPQGKSLSKYLKRPNYEDIEERRKRLLTQFKELNESNNHSKVSSISDTKFTPNKAQLQIEINENSRQMNKKSIAQSPCTKEKILSFTSQNQNTTENSEEGCLPLSLINAQKPRNMRNRPTEIKQQKMGSAFSKKQSIIQKIGLSSNKTGKQNSCYTPGSFSKYKKGSDNVKADSYVNEKRNQIRRFYCQDTEQQFEPISMTKKSLSQHIVSENQQEDDNQFSEIQLKHQVSQKTDTYTQKRISNFEKQTPSRSRQQIMAEKQTAYVMRGNYANRQNNGNRQRPIVQRDHSPSIVSDVSRRKAGYKYFFQE